MEESIDVSIFTSKAKVGKRIAQLKNELTPIHHRHFHGSSFGMVKT
ncbi:hypothetical protein [Bartonella sp. CB178]